MNELLPVALSIISFVGIAALMQRIIDAADPEVRQAAYERKVARIAECPLQVAPGPALLLGAALLKVFLLGSVVLESFLLGAVLVGAVLRV